MSSKSQAMDDENTFANLIRQKIASWIEPLGLKVVDVKNLISRVNLSLELSMVKRRMAIDYGIRGMHVPRADVALYNPETRQPIALISVKPTLQEKMAETGYWKLKYLKNGITENVKVFYITSDAGGAARLDTIPKELDGVIEIAVDCVYAVTDAEIESSQKVKHIRDLTADLESLLEANADGFCDASGFPLARE